MFMSRSRGKTTVLRSSGQRLAPIDPETAVLAARGFTDTARQVVGELSGAAGLPVWLVNRVAGDAYTTLAASGGRAASQVGVTLPWRDTLCATYLSSSGCAVVPDVAASGTAPVVAEKWGLRAYAGMALTSGDGRLLGTLCGFSREPLDVELAHWSSAVLPAHAEELARQLVAALGAAAHARAGDAEVAAASRDELTGLPDRDGWGLLLDREDDRCRRLAEPSGVVLADIGPVRTARSLRRAVAVVQETVGADAVLSRVGGRQLGLLCPGQPADSVADLARQVRDELVTSGCEAVTGWSVRIGTRGLLETWWAAENDLLLARTRQVHGARVSG